jgi:cephalosporin hydroxylase
MRLPRPPLWTRLRQWRRRHRIDSFHRLYYNSLVWQRTRWLGVDIWKCPLDLWIYQEILYEVRPDWIIECGTAHGGSALYLASLFDLLGRGRILTIDIEARPNRPQHPRISYLHGSSTAPETVETVRRLVPPGTTTLVILDSDHHAAHVLEELRLYSPFVTPGSYLIVEDTNVNGHPVYRRHGPGPMEALDAWLPTTPDFAIDPACEKFWLTQNPRGYLRRHR